MTNVKLALRQFRKSPGFAATVILTIALGIGANTAIFTLVHAILLKSLPVTNPATLYRIGDHRRLLRQRRLQERRRRLRSVFLRSLPPFPGHDSRVRATRRFSVRPQHDERPRRQRRSKIRAHRIRLGQLLLDFRTWRLRGPHARSRPTTSRERRRSPSSAIAAWQASHAADPNVVGSTFYIQSQPVTIVGIAPPGFFGDRIDCESARHLDSPQRRARAGRPDQSPQSSRHELALRSWPGEAWSRSRQPASQDLQLRFGSGWRRNPRTPSNGGDTQIPKQHVVVVPGGAGIQNLQQETGDGLHLLTWRSPPSCCWSHARTSPIFLLAKGTARRAETSIRTASRSCALRPDPPGA